MPVNAIKGAAPILTGVDGRLFTPTGQWLQTLEAVRARERRLRTLLPPDDLLALWTAATRADARVYDGLPAHFRREGEHVPFSAGGFGPVRPGWETVPPDAIPAETEALLRWIRTETPREVRAATAYFLFGRIHPFRDGNGRTLRMLYLGLLSGGYPTPTLLACLERLQANRLLLAEAEARTNAGREDLSVFGCLLLRILGMAQYALESSLQSGM